jgi:hypothetical protein
MFVTPDSRTDTNEGITTSPEQCTRLPLFTFSIHTRNTLLVTAHRRCGRASRLTRNTSFVFGPFVTCTRQTPENERPENPLACGRTSIMSGARFVE